jgi:hypothetical protein
MNTHRRNPLVVQEEAFPSHLNRTRLAVFVIDSVFLGVLGALAVNPGLA